MIISENKFLKLSPFFLLLILFIIGSLMDVMDVDAAQYATIGQEMFKNGSYLEVLLRGSDYLDKPPLLFWCSALSYKLFGVSNFSFRLIPILVSFLGFYATYRLSKLYYNETISYLAALLIASSQAYILMNHDLRTDNMLTSLIIVSIWLIATYLKTNEWKYLIIGSVFIGLSMLAKGPIGIMAPAYAFFIDVLLKRRWKDIFRWQWLVALLLIAIVLLPMSIGLYHQFDVHATKESGLKFYYWTQSFGRITGESTWENNPDPLFQVHSFIWGFLPWSLLTLIGYGRETMMLFRKKKIRISIDEEAITWGGVTLIFISMSLSKFQLPHYTYPAFPLAAILGAKMFYYLGTQAKLKKVFVWAMSAQILTIFALWLLGFLLLGWVFPSSNLLWLFVVGMVLLVIFSLFKLKERLDLLIIPAFLTVFSVNILMNIHVYPTLLEYQAEAQAAKYLVATNIPTKQTYRTCKENWYSFDFYLGESVPIIDSPALYRQKDKGTYWVFIDDVFLKDFEKIYPNMKVIKTFNDYPITLLTASFLNPKTREGTFEIKHLIKFDN